MNLTTNLNKPISNLYFMCIEPHIHKLIYEYIITFDFARLTFMYKPIT